MIKIIKIDEKDLKIQLKEIEDSLVSYYKEIKCVYIDTPLLICPNTNKYMIICDDEGMLDERPIVYLQFGQIIYGTMLICKVSNSGKTLSLNENDIEYLKKYLNEGVSFAKIISK